MCFKAEIALVFCHIKGEESVFVLRGDLYAGHRYVNHNGDGFAHAVNHQHKQEGDYHYEKDDFVFHKLIASCQLFEFLFYAYAEVGDADCKQSTSNSKCYADDCI